MDCDLMSFFCVVGDTSQVGNTNVRNDGTLPTRDFRWSGTIGERAKYAGGVCKIQRATKNGRPDSTMLLCTAVTHNAGKVSQNEDASVFVHQMRISRVHNVHDRQKTRDSCQCEREAGNDDTDES